MYGDLFNKLIIKLRTTSLKKIAFFQAFLITSYCGFIGMIFWNGEKVFGKMNNFIGPFLFLLLFCFSVLLSFLATLGYPFVLFWIDKKPKEAIKLVLYTSMWIFIFLLLVAIIVTVF